MEQDIAYYERLYERYRKRVVEEDNVINHRMMWGTLAQTALFGGFGLASMSEISGERATASIAIALVGMSVAFLNHRAISAAHREIRHLVSKYDQLIKRAPEDPARLSITGETGHHSAGHVLDQKLPTLLVFIWICLAAYAISKLPVILAPAYICV